MPISLLVCLTRLLDFFFLTQTAGLLICLAPRPTLKSSADTDVCNVPWYLMSGSILTGFSLAL